MTKNAACLDAPRSGNPDIQYTGLLDQGTGTICICVACRQSSGGLIGIDMMCHHILQSQLPTARDAHRALPRPWPTESVPENKPFIRHQLRPTDPINLVGTAQPSRRPVLGSCFSCSYTFRVARGTVVWLKRWWQIPNSSLSSTTIRTSPIHHPSRRADMSFLMLQPARLAHPLLHDSYPPSSWPSRACCISEDIPSQSALPRFVRPIMFLCNVIPI